MTIRQSALIGFSPFETMTLESFFRLAGRRAPGYAIAASPEAAHVLIVNGDDSAKVQALWAKHRGTKGIVIGNSAHGTDWTAMARPIRLLAVLEQIEVLMASGVPAKPAPAVLRPEAATALSPAQLKVGAPPAAAPRATQTPAPAPVFTPMPVSTPAPTPVPSAVAALATSAMRMFSPNASPAPAAKPPAKFPRSTGFANSVGFDAFKPSLTQETPAQDDDLILVVDDSDIVLRFMQGRLQRFGYSVALATSGEQAVEMAKARDYKFVFLDVMMPGIDGYQTCRMIKAAKTGGAVPVVVMLSSRGGSIDKIRGTLAGANAYLTKPLAEAALIKVLADHDTQTAVNFSATRPVTGIR